MERTKEYIEELQKTILQNNETILKMKSNNLSLLEINEAGNYTESQLAFIVKNLENTINMLNLKVSQQQMALLTVVDGMKEWQKMFEELDKGVKDGTIKVTNE